MNKTLNLFVGEFTARGIRHANTYVNDARVVKFLRTHEYFEGVILHLGHTLLGFAPA